MEIILSVLILVGFWMFHRDLEKGVSNHCNNYNVDWGKVNEDRIMNDLSGNQVNMNISTGKYDAGRIRTNEEIKASQKADWEEFKKRHPNGNWN